MKYKIKIILLLNFFLYLNISYSMDYYCPKLPIEVKIGETLDSGWFIWPEKEPNSLINRYYYKFFGESHKIKYWGGFPSGIVKSNDKEISMFIACCMLKKDSKEGLCAFKYVVEKKCEPVLPSVPPVKYSCKNN